MDKYQLYYEVAKSQLDAQDDRKAQLEFRAGAAFVLSVLLVGIVVLTAPRPGRLGRLPRFRGPRVLPSGRRLRV